MGGVITKIRTLPLDSNDANRIEYAYDSENNYGLWLGGLWWDEKHIAKLEQAICDFKNLRGMKD